MDTRFAFYDRLMEFNEKHTFQHFDFSRDPKVDRFCRRASAAEFPKNSPYKDQLGTAEALHRELQQRSHEIPNLISPRLGDIGLIQLPVTAKVEGESDASRTSSPFLWADASN